MVAPNRAELAYELPCLMVLLMHTHDSLLKELKIASLCKLSVAFFFFLSERVL